MALLALAASAAHAQAPSRPGSDALPAPPAAVSQADTDRALAVLKDPARRAELIAVLEAMAKASSAPPAAKPAAPSPAAPVAPAPAVAPPAAAPVAPAGAAAPAAPAAAPVSPLLPDSLGAQLVADASDQLSELSDTAVAAVRSITDFPLLGRWVKQVSGTAEIRDRLFEAVWSLALVLGLGVAGEIALRRALRRPRQNLADRAPATPIEAEDRGLAEAEAGQTENFHERGWHRWPSPLLLLRRLPYAIGYALLGLLPLAALLAFGFAALRTPLGGHVSTRHALEVGVNGYLAFRLAVAVAALLVAPGAPNLRLVHCSDETAGRIMTWTRRLAGIAIFGTTIIEVGAVFGLYQLAQEALLKYVALAVALCLIVVIMEARGTVAAWLRSSRRSSGTMISIRNTLASVWHIVAIFYVVALWLVWALDLPGGFARLLRLFLMSGAVLLVARLVAGALISLLRRALRVGPASEDRYPGLQDRMRSYYPIGRALVQLMVGAAAVVGLCEVWGFEAVSWFAPGALGGRLVASLSSIAISVAVGLVVWESTNLSIQRYLARLTRDAQVARSARLRTLLPMFRTTLLVTICIVLGLIALSELGVNIAPLLAGAGVLGIAIGLGGQKLMQDVITGLFLLLENTMQVGDVVTLGGLSGTVENLSIRTIRLRALDGSIHIVPFSAVTTVTNQTRDFGFAVMDISIGLNESPDRIGEVLKKVAGEMRDEPRWDTAVLGDLEVLGLERFAAAVWVMRVRIRTTPSQRWAVAREMNRRIKYRFDELAIDSPMTSYKALKQDPPNVIEVPAEPEKPTV